MTTQERARRDGAIEIAKDVLEVARSKCFNIAQGVYVKSRLISSHPIRIYDLGLREHMNMFATVDAPCQVCARGAMFIAKVRLHNDCKIRNAYNRYDTTTHLAPWFSEEQLGLIECAFEQNLVYATTVDTTAAWAARDFGSRYDDPRKRLVAIAENIIANDGEFQPR